MTRDLRSLPALRFYWLTSCYDPLVRLTTRERRFKRDLIAQIGATPGQRVLDVGCGSATLALALKREQPLALISGLDADPRNAVMRALFLVVQLLDGFETTADHVSGRFAALLSDAGFRDVRERQRLDTPVGTLGLFSCSVA